MTPAVRERQIEFSKIYLVGSPEEVRWRKHAIAKKKLVRYGTGRWSALHPSLWDQAEKELQIALEDRVTKGLHTPPELLPRIIGGVITAIKIAGGRNNLRKHISDHTRNVRRYKSEVLKSIALGKIPRPEGMR